MRTPSPRISLNVRSMVVAIGQMGPTKDAEARAEMRMYRRGSRLQCLTPSCWQCKPCCVQRGCLDGSSSWRILVPQSDTRSCRKLVHRQQRHCASSEWLVVRTPQRALPCTPPMHHAETTTTSMAHWRNRSPGRQGRTARGRTPPTSYSPWRDRPTAASCVDRRAQSGSLAAASPGFG